MMVAAPRGVAASRGLGLADLLFTSLGATERGTARCGVARPDPDVSVRKGDKKTGAWDSPRETQRETCVSRMAAVAGLALRYDAGWL